MLRLHKWLNLDRQERRLLLRAALLVAAVRLGLWLLPFRTVRRLLAHLAQEPVRTPENERPSVEHVARAVRRVNRYVPKATCLVQAMAGQILLERRGYPAFLRFGVAKDDNHNFEAHAWVESQGRVVIGESGPRRYTPLVGFGEEGYRV